MAWHLESVNVNIVSRIETTVNTKSSAFMPSVEKRIHVSEVDFERPQGVRVRQILFEKKMVPSGIGRNFRYEVFMPV